MQRQRQHTRGSFAPLTLAWLLVTLTTLAGCQPEVRVVRDGWGEWAQEMGANRQGWAVAAGGQRGDLHQALNGQRYTIVLERFVGRDAAAQGEAYADRVRSETGLAGVRVLQGAATVTVSVGEVTDPGGPEAQRLLRQVRKAELDGVHPYSEAQFATADPRARPVYDPLNLKQFEGNFSLQVAFYNDEYQGDRRKAAEDAARALREQGHQAFYYHGPFNSLVTVGLFTQNDFVMRNNTQAYGPRMKALQEEFPYNLGNGLTLIEKRDGKVIGEQESCIVRVI